MYRAELLGVRTVRATTTTALVAVLGLIVTQLAFVTLLPALARGDIGPGAEAIGDLPATALTTMPEQLAALSPLGATSGSGSLGVVVIAMTLLGVLAGTSDFRFGGIVGAALASPRRGRIVVAKAAAVATVAAVIGLALAVVSGVTLVVSLGASGLPLALDVPAALAVLGRGVLVVVLLALIGLAVGVLIRGQLAAVLVMLSVLVLEPIVQATVGLVVGSSPAWTQFLPVALAQAAVGSAPAILSPVVAIVGVVALAAIGLVAAAVSLTRRDV
jgi:hypothetical protein